MALKTAEQKAEEIDTVLLELAMYAHYTWNGETYEQGKAYRFKKDVALVLMAEQDHARPVWRMYRPVKPRQAPKNQVVDVTDVKATQTREALESAPARRIEVGTDEEISDILNRPDTGGDVTV